MDSRVMNSADIVAAGGDTVARSTATEAKTQVEYESLRTAIPNVYNLKSSNMRKWRKARSTVATGRGRAKLACVGPSTMTGAPGPARDYVDIVSYSIPAMLTAKINPSIRAEFNSFFGTHNYSTSVLIDPRVAIGNTSAWIRSPDNGGNNTASLGGPPFYHATSGDQSLITFTPAVDYDNCTAFLIANTGSAAIDVLFSGTLSESVNLRLTPGIRARPYNSASPGGASVLAAPGKYPISVRKSISTAAPLRFVGFECWNSLAPAISVANFGYGSSTTSDQVNQAFAWNLIASLPVYAPDLTIVMPDTNGWNAGLSVATMIANVTLEITTARLTGDAMIVIFHPDPRRADTTSPTQAEYTAALKALALSVDCPYIDLQERFISPAMFVSDGWTPAGDVHPFMPAYDDIAGIVAQAVLA